MDCLIDFSEEIRFDALPESFNNPFDYSPHPLCLKASEQIQSLLPKPSESEKGKMYGVLIATTIDNRVGFLTAYSGNEQNFNSSIPFVPQVFDITNPDGFFRIGEADLNKINTSIFEAEHSPDLIQLQKELNNEIEQAKLIIDQVKAAIATAKSKRDIIRQKSFNKPDYELVKAKLINESQREKSQLSQLKKKYQKQIEDKKQELDAYLKQIKKLKKIRKQQSAKLQEKLFNHYLFLNANGETQSASAIFSETAQKVPPAGTGDCCAPKLLHYAFQHQFTPVAMAEFWWGTSPKKEIRHHGYFYPACKSKCEPILGHMLQGLEIEGRECHYSNLTIELINEDEAIAIINKPAGLLSVPGKEENTSVYTQVKKLYPNATGPLIVHRLDMATSGLMIIAKNKEVHENLQKQFLNKTVEKQYVAWLDGIIQTENGQIDLPLRVDLDDRPRQLVCNEYGKPAVTRWEVIEHKENRTKVHFYPLTGRTHQLRVHAAHPLGLNTPITGDELYGKKNERLLLHAEEISFIHPTTSERVTFKAPSPF
ncbi:pseudouridine synthase [Carboxylicivirga caseinilyticus]|uniref:pseudouridine synthase n=1 Tax=Carboxylicivirga caseinilyticus TaxID=3417572 RepID=UPI003D3450DD|nr:RNA pseudouridine synthase [Marinilabiliaceae bacterium A049]